MGLLNRLRQPVRFEAFAVGLRQAGVGLGVVGDRAMGGVPHQRFAGHTDGDGSEQDGFCQRNGIVEVRGRLIGTSARIGPTHVVVSFGK